MLENDPHTDTELFLKDLDHNIQTLPMYLQIFGVQAIAILHLMSCGSHHLYYT